MKAKFIGKSSYGFEHGKIYEIRSEIMVTRIGGPVFGENVPSICIYHTKSNSFCPYKNLESLVKNWEFVK